MRSVCCTAERGGEGRLWIVRRRQEVAEQHAAASVSLLLQQCPRKGVVVDGTQWRQEQ